MYHASLQLGPHSHSDADKTLLSDQIVTEIKTMNNSYNMIAILTDCSRQIVQLWQRTLPNFKNDIEITIQECHCVN